MVEGSHMPDFSTLWPLVADDFMGTALGPSVATKDDIVPAQEANTNRLSKSSLRETTVRVFGDCAVLIALTGIAIEGWKMRTSHRPSQCHVLISR